ncbi:MAG: 50S ribosomal protein L19 [candidate division WS6 bacterium OLB20]|uniref:Large ribosomal subunit protein bL19 n=1 Tax=candidate division WS6 bacterium OLB20 TaxID=1617426 RepID=A0A136LWE4_9BACT|nr:MAG: 50S ribosomal protein L19 [candidate division WS6 bacterium OLB20]
MDTVLTKIEKPFLKKAPRFEVGDTVAVHAIVREGDKQRVQIFKGIVLAIKGEGLGRTFTVRKISSGIGVEKIFPLHSPNVDKIEVLKSGHVTSSKIYYMRGRVGKRALKVAEGQMYSDEELNVYEDGSEEPADSEQPEAAPEPETAESSETKDETKAA